MQTRAVGGDVGAQRLPPRSTSPQLSPPRAPLSPHEHHCPHPMEPAGALHPRAVGRARGLLGVHITTAKAPQPWGRREGAPPYPSWAFAFSRCCCILSWHDRMASTSWAKAKHDPVSVQTHSSCSHSAPNQHLPFWLPKGFPPQDQSHPDQTRGDGLDFGVNPQSEFLRSVQLRWRKACAALSSPDFSTNPLRLWSPSYCRQVISAPHPAHFQPSCLQEPPLLLSQLRELGKAGKLSGAHCLLQICVCVCV